MNFVQTEPIRVPLTVGVYEVGTNVVAGGEVELSAIVQLTDETCESILSSGPGFSFATDGTVMIESLGPERVEGRYSLTFPEGTVTGHFGADYCALTIDGAPVCAPVSE